MEAGAWPVGRCGVILTWTILAVAWGMLAREYNTGRRHLTAIEGALFFGALLAATVTAIRNL